MCSISERLERDRCNWMIPGVSSGSFFDYPLRFPAEFWGDLRLSIFSSAVSFVGICRATFGDEAAMIHVQTAC
ncbi:hypothetical protein K443DRAFT_513106 [Laccaria amethystina LaAM-08-1]|uniref:Uncharacterized protein n=1 Tax=Laccaria amethystina LaAM-08-1 TaxID=1095629 RepID=A0A0C9WHC4_9AGAR|nr:hypothetical protein K443DRAFT_513106 [Laccaria amethystina LaAM-08-1]